MRKLNTLVIGLIMVMLFAGHANTGQVYSNLLFNGTSIAASQTSTSVAVDLSKLNINGVFAVHYTVAGSGTAKLEYLVCSTSGGTYMEPAAATDIATGKTSGTYYATFEPEVTPFIKIKATETGGANSITLTLRLVVQ